jgi:uroporphyrinogen-III synthase
MQEQPLSGRTVAGPPELAKAALERTQVAAVGPVVAEALAKHRVAVRFMPQDSFFTKPLTSAIAAGVHGA